MKKWIITAESGSDITKEEAGRLGIELIPMYVTMGEETFKDGTFPPEEVCRYYNETKKVPKTSGCSPYDFKQLFEKVHKEHPEAHILHLAYSAATTVSYSSACMQAKGKDYITVIDTKHVSAGQRAVVLQVLDLLEKEPDIALEDLTQQIETICKRTKMCFLPANLDYLRAGGRCSNAAWIGATLLHLHPSIEILDGKLIATKKYRGSFRRVVPKVIKEYTKVNHLDKTHLWLISTPGLSDKMKALAEHTAQECRFRQISWVATGNVITSHGGAGAIGIVGIEE